MNIFRRIVARTKSFFGDINFSFGSSWLRGSDVPNASQADYLETYASSNLIRAALGKIAEKAGTIELELYSARFGQAKQIDQHELLDLLANPNPLMSGDDLWGLTAIYIKALGNAYWYKAMGDNGKIIELWPVRSDLMEPKIDNSGVLVGYKFWNGGKEQIYTTEEIIHFKEPNPLSLHIGVGYLRSLIEIVRADIYSKRWNTRYFYNSARPDGILTSDEQIDKDDREDLAKSWQAKYGSFENAHKVAVLSSGLKFQAVGDTHKDMDFPELRHANRDDVLMTLGVPKSVLAISDDVNRSNAETGVYVFLSQTIEPLFRKFVNKLNHSFIRDVDPSLYFDYQDPTPEDEEALDTHFTTALNKWMTVNEVREDAGLEPVDGGDVLYMPIGLLPLGQNDMGNTDTTTGDNQNSILQSGRMVVKTFQTKKTDTRRQKKLKAIYKMALRGNKLLRFQEELFDLTLTKTIENLKRDQATPKLKKWSTEEKQAIWKLFDVHLYKWETYWKAFQANLFDAQAARIKKQLKASDLGKGVNKASSLDFVDWEKENEIFKNRAHPVYIEIVQDAAQRAMALVGKSFDVTDKKTAAWILKKAITFAREVNKTTKKRLKAALAEGLLAGEGIPDLAKRVDEVMGARIVSSAETIARTEVLSSSNAGTLFGYEQTDIIESKEWLSTLDGKTRDAHMNADGQVVSLKDNFSVGNESLQYPGDPNGSAENIINCRCTLIPVIKA